MTTERDRARDAYDRLAHHQEKTFNVPYPPENKPTRATLPPVSRYWPGPNLPVEHEAADCTDQRRDSTGWHDAYSGDRVLVVTRCLGCGGTARRRFASATP